MELFIIEGRGAFVNDLCLNATFPPSLGKKMLKLPSEAFDTSLMFLILMRLWKRLVGFLSNIENGFGMMHVSCLLTLSSQAMFLVIAVFPLLLPLPKDHCLWMLSHKWFLMLLTLQTQCIEHNLIFNNAKPFQFLNRISVFFKRMTAF